MENIVLIWAGWTWMSGIVWILHDLWFSNLICIDSTKSEATEKLEKKWIPVIIGHGKYIPQAEDSIIYSEATADCIEIKQLKEKARAANKIPLILNYFQFLWEISKYFISVGFAWTNGKSSSTAVAIYGAKDTLPNFAWWILGALVPDLDQQSYYLNPEVKEDMKIIFRRIFTGNTGKNANEIYEKNLIKKYYFFIEACERRRHFLYLDLDYTIIASLELDHTDYYKDRDDYLNAFKTLIIKTKKAVYIPETLKDIFQKEEKIKIIPQENIPFKYIFWNHNNSNGSLVLALLKELGSEKEEISWFKWLRRRMELIYTNPKWWILYSDYWHVASSIALWCKALQEKYPKKKIILIFQPHQMARIIQGWKEFSLATKGYNEVIIYDIYAARENFEDTKPHLENISIHVNNINELGIAFATHCWWTYTTDIQDIKKRIDTATEDEIIVIFSAGDIDYKIRNLLHLL